MLREFSAIGMSRYTNPKAVDQLVSELLEKGPLKGQQFFKDGALHVEIFKEMGPFQMVLRGEIEEGGYIHIFMVLPALKEKRGYEFIECETMEVPGDVIYLAGQEKHTLEGLCLALTEVHRFYKEKDLFQKEKLYVSCYGLSIEGKVILGIERTQEDVEAIEEGEEQRRQLLSRAMDGDEDAMDQIQDEEERTQQEIEERLQYEDVYSIFDGFLYPAEGEGEHYFTILGDILYVDKLMNSFTEEWVYYLSLDVLGQNIRVCINPRDLLGEPLPGRRFTGKVWLYGRLDPARLILEDQSAFF